MLPLPRCPRRSCQRLCKITHIVETGHECARGGQEGQGLQGQSRVLFDSVHSSCGLALDYLKRSLRWDLSPGGGKLRVCSGSGRGLPHREPPVAPACGDLKNPPPERLAMR